MAKNKVIEAVVSFAGVIDPSLAKSIEGAEKYVDNLAKKLKTGAVVAAITSIPVLTAKAVADAGSYLADLGNEYNTAINQLSAATGATGDELDALGESVKNIYAQGLGDDFADVADGLAATQQASDLTGEALERATAAGFNLRDVFDYDVSESARAASALMKNFGIDAEEAYGLIAVGAQNGADKNGDLLDTLNEYSPQFAALGLSADQFIGTLVEGADAGLFSIDKVGDAVKEFNIRAKDGSDTSREAFESLGLNADKMFAAFAAGGDTAEAAFFDTVEALNSMDDPLARNAAGVALFGTQFEDLEAGVLPVLASIETAAYSAPQSTKDKRSKSWERVKFLQLIQEIAGRHGLTVETYGITDQTYDYVEQNNLPDFAFLQARCTLEGAAFLVYDGKLVVYDEAYMEGQQPVDTITITPANDFEYRDEGAYAYGSAEAVNGGLTGTFSAPAGGDKVLRKILPFRMTDQAEADRFAKGLLRDANKEATVATLWTGTLLREYAAGSVVTLSTEGVASWDGTAFVSRIRHDYVKTRSKLYLRKPLEGY